MNPRPISHQTPAGSLSSISTVGADRCSWQLGTRYGVMWVAALTITIGLAAASVPAGAMSPANESPAATLEVAVGLPPHVWLVEQVAGERARAFAIVGPGDNHHTYQPTDAEISRLTRAALFFHSGMGFEQAPWFRSLAASGAVKRVDLRAGLGLRTLEESGHEDEGHHEEGKDPHVWLAPRLLARQARTVEAALTAVDPSGAPHYRGRRLRFEAAMRALDSELRATLEPIAGSAFFVFHPAWGYFADAYGLEQMAIESEGKEPSEAELTGLARLARQRGIRTVFVQPQISGSAARAVADAVGAELEVLDPLAPDVAANLRRVAARLVASHRDTPRADTP